MCNFELIYWMQQHPDAKYRCNTCSVESVLGDKIESVPASGGPAFNCKVCNPSSKRPLLFSDVTPIGYKYGKMGYSHEEIHGYLFPGEEGQHAR